MASDPQLFLQKHRKLIFWGIQLFIWSFYFVFDVEIIHRYVYSAFRSPDLSVYLRPFLFCFFGLPLTLIIKGFTDRFFQSYKTKPLYWIALIILAIVMGFVWYGFDRFLERCFIHYGGFANELVDFFWKVFIASLILIAWTLVYLFIRFWEDWLEQKLKTEQALLMAENARLRMLRYQVNPHFLFNTLSSLRGLIRKDPAQAVQMVGLMSEFMRYSLGNKADLMVTLNEEMQAVKNYIGIEQVRFGDKLKAGFQMDESSLSLMIPSFILHPLVENAIKYGMETSPMPLQVTIHSEYDGKRLTLAVTNSGKWVPGNSEIMGTGTGLQNVRDRLAVTYQSKHRFGIDKEDGKVTVRMVIEQINYGQKNHSADRG